MTTVTDLWTQAEPVFRNKAYRMLDNDPQILLEHDGGPVDVQADVILARLIGFEDEIVADAVRLSSVMPVYLVPILSTFSALTEAVDPPPVLPRPAEYVLQSGYAVVPLAAEYAPPDATVGPPSFTFRVLYLRYRRRA